MADDAPSAKERFEFLGSDPQSEFVMLRCKKCHREIEVPVADCVNETIKHKC